MFSLLFLLGIVLSIGFLVAFILICQAAIDSYYDAIGRKR